MGGESTAGFGAGFFRLAGLCSALSAVTTLVLIYGPSLYPAPATLEDRIALLADPWFRLRAWTYYLHPFLCFVAALGTWALARRFDAGMALLGVVFLGLWAVTEAMQQALSLVALNWTWRAGYAAADSATQAAYRQYMDMFAALWDGLYFLLLTGFLLGNLCYALALRRAPGLGRVLAVLFALAAALSVLNFLAGYGGPDWAGAVAGAAYPLVQPAARLLLGVWLWRASAPTGRTSPSGA
ncbi:MAG TPA: hypothetical protein VEB20_05790 [Azospirillaceae bacterium]|nr:hypothetical protein [Azospirillaceae bacterium]